MGKEIPEFDKVLPEKSVLDNFTLLALRDFTKCANTCVSNVTLNCQVAKIVMNTGSQLSEL